MNMGTPQQPEGVQHWSNVAMFAQKLESRRKRQQGFWLFFRGCCGQCEGGALVENILADVTAVKRESDFGGFRPDILLERGGKPPIFLEFTHTSPSSVAKLAYCTANGIDLFELDGSKLPADSSLMKAHISLRNCRKRQRQRLLDLWKHMDSLDDPVVGVKEDFRSPQRQRRESEAREAKFEALRNKAAAGTLLCARCDKSLATGDTGFSVSFIDIHKPEGHCGQVQLCQECEFRLRGGWNGVYPDDATSWGLDESCQGCQTILAKQAKQLEQNEQKASQLRSVEMPEPYGTRLVQEPEQRLQAYIVGKRTVSRDELLSVLVMFEYILRKALPPVPISMGMLSEVVRIKKAVQYPNNIIDWDWFEGIGEGYISEHDSPDNSEGDKHLLPKRWPGWQQLPPCPLLWL